MVSSIGNNGLGGLAPDGLFAAGAPGVGGIGVASFDNAQRSFVVGGTPRLQSRATASPTAPAGGLKAAGAHAERDAATESADDAAHPGRHRSRPLAADLYTAASGAAATWQGGTTLAAGSLAGQVSLVRRGNCGFHAKA
ncbi:MAG: hypothetical protein U1F49_07750 [Rubrivivax sp.]